MSNIDNLKEILRLKKCIADVCGYGIYDVEYSEGLKEFYHIKSRKLITTLERAQKCFPKPVAVFGEPFKVESFEEFEDGVLTEEIFDEFCVNAFIEKSQATQLNPQNSPFMRIMKRLRGEEDNMWSCYEVIIIDREKLKELAHEFVIAKSETMASGLAGYNKFLEEKGFDDNELLLIVENRGIIRHVKEGE